MRLPKEFVFALLLLSVVGISWLHARSSACMTDTQSIPAIGGKSFAEIVETSCDVLGGSNVVEISIVSSGGILNKRFPVFKYDPSSFSGPINVAWMGDREFAISIDRVDGVETKETHVDGYTVSYHIGAVGPLVTRETVRVQR